jgi:hypothetical protein
VPAAEAASASAFGRIAAEAALREDAETETRDGLPPINAAVGLTKEAAFENMQALLREKSVAKKKNGSADKKRGRRERESLRGAEKTKTKRRSIPRTKTTRTKT